jgi:hypothetical protein
MKNIQGYLIVNDSVVIDSHESITSLPDSASVETFTTANEMYQEAFNRGLIDAIPEEEKVPEQITVRQARLILLKLGYLDDVELYMETDKASQIEWEYASVFRRDNELLNSTADKMGIPQDIVDKIFIEGVKL